MEWNAGLSTLFVDNLKLKMSSLDSRHYNRSITKKLLNLLVSYLGEYLVFDLKLKTKDGSNWNSHCLITPLYICLENPEIKVRSKYKYNDTIVLSLLCTFSSDYLIRTSFCVLHTGGSNILVSSWYSQDQRWPSLSWW